MNAPVRFAFFIKDSATERSPMPDQKIAQLLAEVRACTVCAAQLSEGARPIVQFSATSRIVIIGQAPGKRVHESGIPWNDASGERLREWTGLTTTDFYDSSKVALIPMGFCYPGTGKNGDLPPRSECAPLWHDRILAELPSDRLLLLVGSYAQVRYIQRAKESSLTDKVRKFSIHGPNYFPLPHPSWRSSGWMTKNPWFELEVLPALRTAVTRQIGGHSLGGLLK
jgi:uracil-DNA glycosylase